MNGWGRIFPGAWPGGDKAPESDRMPCGCSPNDSVCLAGSFDACCARQMAIGVLSQLKCELMPPMTRQGVESFFAREQAARDYAERYIAPAAAAIVADGYAALVVRGMVVPSRVRSGRERLGE